MTTPTPNPAGPAHPTARIRALVLLLVPVLVDHMLDDFADALGLWFDLTAGALTCAGLLWYALASPQSPVVLRWAWPAVLLAYGALLVVISTVRDLPDAWPIIGPTALAVLAAVCAAKDYPARGHRQAIGAGLFGAGTAMACSSAVLAVAPFVGLAVAMAGVGIGIAITGLAFLANRTGIMVGSMMGTMVAVVACGLLTIPLLDPTLGIAIVVGGGGVLAAFIAFRLGRRRIAWLGLTAGGQVVLMMAAVLASGGDVHSAMFMVTFGSVQAAIGVACLIGRRVVLESALVLVGLTILAGGVVVTVALSRSYGVAVIGCGLPFAAYGIWLRMAVWRGWPAGPPIPA